MTPDELTSATTKRSRGWSPARGHLETDVEKASRVSVAFTADGDRTRVVVVHKDFWRMAEGGQGMADAVGSVDGWGSGLKHFADFAAK